MSQLEWLEKRVEELAWSMPAPNPYTPQLISLVMISRDSRAKQQADWRKLKKDTK